MGGEVGPAEVSTMRKGCTTHAHSFCTEKLEWSCGAIVLSVLDQEGVSPRSIQTTMSELP